MMKYSLFCSGSKGNSFYLADGDVHLLVDCGASKHRIMDGFTNFHANVQDLDAILITHNHSDHISALKYFKNYLIYAPINLDDIPVTLIAADKPFNIKHLKIVPIALSHDAGSTLGYVFDNGQERLLYMTDTGYLHEKYFSYLKGLDYIVIESNHDVEMLMHTNRPYYLKRRILSDEGHLSNNSCANILEHIVTTKTKYIWLAHLSQEANTPKLALQCSLNVLRKIPTNSQLMIAAAEQFRPLKKGDQDEEMDFGNYYSFVNMESFS